jgi:hypothetical protein
VDEKRRERWRRTALVALAAAVLVDRPGVELALTWAGLAAFAVFPPRREKLGWAIVVILLLARATSLVPLGVVAHLGKPAGAVFIAGLAIAGFFATARAISPPAARPGFAAQALATIVALLISVEGGLRVAQEGDGDAVLANAVPLFAVTPVNGALAPTDEARLDFRQHLFEPRKPSATFRVLLLGGSTAWGYMQASRDATPAAMLERTLVPIARGRRPEVVCLAYPGYTSDQELGVWLAGASRFEADLVLALDAYNDMLFSSRRDAYPGYHHYWKQHRFGLGRPFLRELSLRSKILRPFLREWLWTEQPSATLSTTLVPGAANDFWLGGLVANEESLALLARARGAAFVWAPVPLSYDRLVPGPHEGDPKVRRESPFREEVVARSRAARERAGPAVEACGGTVLDLGRAFAARSSAGEDWFADECHLTDRGVEVLAEEVASGIARAEGVR